jgi:hypothetical protein
MKGDNKGMEANSEWASRTGFWVNSYQQHSAMEIHSHSLGAGTFTIMWRSMVGGWFDQYSATDFHSLHSLMSLRPASLRLPRECFLWISRPMLTCWSLGVSHVTSHHNSSMVLAFHSPECEDQHLFKVSGACSPFTSFFNLLTTQLHPMVTKKMIDSPLIRQLSQWELSWLRTEVANTVVGAKLKVGTGGGAVVYVRRDQREVIACVCPLKYSSLHAPFW